VAGTQNLGSGNITFAVGDFVLYTADDVWVDIPTGGSGVQTFNGRSGIVTLLSGDVTNALSDGSVVNSKLQNPNVTVTTGTGLSGGQVLPLGGTITLTNTGVTGAVGGTGVTVSAATGNVTFSIGQNVATNATVQFNAISSTTTISATGNVTGGNLTTGGRVVATGNIVTSGYIITPNTSINNGIVTTGNITGTNLAITSAGTFGTTLGVTGNITGGNLTTVGLISATGNITGGNLTTAGRVTATGNVTGGNVVAVANVTTANLTVTGISNLNSNANVKITGGTNAQALITDGAGNLSWANVANISGGTASQIVGTWVPTLTASGGGSFTYSTQLGNYIKSGRSVSLFFTIVISGASGASGTVSVSGFPVVSSNASGAQGGGALDNYSFSVLPIHVTGIVPSNSSSFDLYWHDRSGSTNNLTLMTTGQLGTSATLTGRVTYISQT
jgi:hypothetical protein